jgi:hypothetical protein
VFQLSAIVGADVQNGPGRASPHKAFVDFMSNPSEVAVERFSDTRQVRVIAEQNFFLNSEVQLRRFASIAVNDAQRIERFGARLMRAKKMIAPRL